MSSVFNRIEDDHIYYNILIANDDFTKTITASFQETRTSPLIRNPADYHMSVQRFSVPSTLIPIFIFKDNTYKVTLTYSATNFTQTVVFIQTNQTDATDRNIYVYQNFLNAINTAFAAAFAALIAAFPAAPPASAPYLTFNPVTQLISLVADERYDPTVAGAATVEIWTNYQLYAKIQTFEFSFAGYAAPVKNVQLIVKDEHNNRAGGFITMTQEVVSLGYMFDLKSIVFTSTMIPGRGEAIPANSVTSQDSSRKILVDFEPDLSGNAVNPPGSIYYQFYAPSANYRLIDLQGNTPITTIDVQVYWMDHQQNLHLININPGTCLTAKLLFSKKNSLH